MSDGAEHFFHRDEIISRLDCCLNKTLGDVDSNGVFNKTKTNPKITGIAGDVVEQSILGYPADNRQEPDLDIDGIKTELKTTGIRYSKKENNKYEAKEPMSITAVSPDTIVDEEFESSKFWDKLEHLLFVYYLYASNKTVAANEYAQFPIKGYEFYEFKAEDVSVLKNDWLLVRDFIKGLRTEFTDYKAQYPRLSSELREKLLYIDTAPKWPHPPRFRLKRTVITNIVQEHFGPKLEQLPDRYTSLADIDSQCRKLTESYRGKTIKELMEIFGITGESSNKAVSERIIVRMFGGQAKKMSQIELFNKIGMIGKSIVITKQGLRTEDMKLFRIDFDELCDKEVTFEESSFNNFFADNQMLCIIFEEPQDSRLFEDNVFLGFKRLAFSEEFIARNVQTVWDTIRSLIFNNQLRDIPVIDKKTGLQRVNKTGVFMSAPNFPKSATNIVFVRGGSADSSSKTVIVNNIKMYIQSIWIKGSYIADKLSNMKYL